MTTRPFRPMRGVEVVAVMADGHEFEAEFGHETDNETFFVVETAEDGERYGHYVPEVKPRPVVLPTAFGSAVTADVRDGGRSRRTLLSRTALGTWRYADSAYSSRVVVERQLSNINVEFDAGTVTL